MTKMLVSMTLALGALASPALAGETTVTLAVRNWSCAACPHVIKQSLAAVPGVINVTVSDKTKTASVTFDDTKTDVKSPLITSGPGGAVFAAFSRGAPVRPGRERLCRLTKAAGGQAIRLPLISE